MTLRTTKEIYDIYKRDLYRLWNARDKARNGFNTDWTSWHRIDARFNREYYRAEHRSHVAEGRDGCYLWCEHCQKTATLPCSQCGEVSALYDIEDRVCRDCASAYWRAQIEQTAKKTFARR